VDDMGRCVVQWKTNENAEDGKDAEIIENNKQLKWSWIYQQQNKRTD
jgi:hypothetical protein